MDNRTLDIMSLAIELSSPSGRVSKRALKATQERLRLELFGKAGLPAPTCKQPSEYKNLMRQAQNLRELASRGMKPRAYIKEAKRLELKAKAAQVGDLSTPSTHGR